MDGVLVGAVVHSGPHFKSRVYTSNTSSLSDPKSWSSGKVSGFNNKEGSWLNLLQVLLTHSKLVSSILKIVNPKIGKHSHLGFLKHSHLRF